MGTGDYQEELQLPPEQPGAGTAHLFAMPMAGQIFLPLRLYFYGDQGAATATQAEPA